MKRREFLNKATVAGIGGAGLMLSGFLRRLETFAQSPIIHNISTFGFGDLVPKAAQNTREICLSLPKGFEYKIIGRVGSQLSDGQSTPRLHDGMGIFQTNGQLRIVRNHEINDRIGKENVAIGSANHYDESAGGGTTTLIVNRKTRETERSFISLSGTLNNCGGGATPWGSWISCEETTFGQTKFTTSDGNQAGGFLKPHGYCFEVPASMDTNLPPVPLVAMGRFVHEAVAFDTKSGIVYQTEDNNPAGFYRFLPNRKKRLADGGPLQVLRVKTQPNYDTRRGQKLGSSFQATWVTIKNSDPAEADTDKSAVYNQGAQQGAAIFARLEGCFPDKNGSVYFASTNGGDALGGQIWLYQPTGSDQGRLTLVYESTDRTILDMPDNITLHPKHRLLYMCEDSDYGLAGATPENYIRILTPDGRIADFAKNIMPDHEKSEFAGAIFSKDGETLFVNIQAAGVTAAIWGDWKSFRP